MFTSFVSLLALDPAVPPITSSRSMDKRRVSSAVGHGWQTVFLFDGRRRSRTASRLPNFRDGAAIVSKRISMVDDKYILTIEACQMRIDISVPSLWPVQVSTRPGHPQALSLGGSTTCVAGTIQPEKIKRTSAFAITSVFQKSSPPL